MMNSASTYLLRDFLPGNQAEIERINLMYYHPTVMKSKGYFKRGLKPVTKEDLLEEDRSMFKVPNRVTESHEDVSYAVADLKNNLIGWIWFYQDARHPLPIRVVKELGLQGNYRTYQVSYEKLMSEDWPDYILKKVVHTDHRELHRPRKGVIVEGLRLALSRVSREFKKIHPPEIKLAVYGYVLPSNVASAKVLEKNGFAKVQKQYSYSKVLHDLWVKII